MDGSGKFGSLMLDFAVSSAGAGATASTGNAAAVFVRRVSVEGAGATTSGVIAGTFVCNVCVRADSGTAEGIGVHATRLGIATSLGSLRGLGVTIV